MAIVFYLAVVLHAAAAFSGKGIHCVRSTDMFDDIQPNLLSSLTTPIKSQNGLAYSNWNAQRVNPGAVGFLAQSSPNVAVASLTTILLNGKLSLTPHGTISAGENTISFNLETFYIGCSIVPLVAFVGVAQTCTITISGFYATGAQVASESFDFGNTAGLSNSLVFVRPQGVWKELRNVTFAVTSALLVASTVQMVVDNVQHCNYLDRQGVEESASELAAATVATSSVGLSASTARVSSSS